MRQGLEEGRCSYLGRSHRFARIGEKSAEAIVAIGNEPRIETVEDSQGREGLNA